MSPEQKDETSEMEARNITGYLGRKNGILSLSSVRPQAVLIWRRTVHLQILRGVTALCTN